MSEYNPKYTVAIQAASTSTKYDITPVVTNLSLSEPDSEIAQKVSISIANVQVDGQYLSGIFKVRDRVFVYANDGEKEEEVFRGFIWARGYKSKKAKELQFVCYDNLIFYIRKAYCCKGWGQDIYNFF